MSSFNDDSEIKARLKRAFKPVKPDTVFKERTLARLREATARPATRLWGLRPAVVAMTAVMLVATVTILAFVILRGTQQLNTQANLPSTTTPALTLTSAPIVPPVSSIEMQPSTTASIPDATITTFTTSSQSIITSTTSTLTSQPVTSTTTPLTSTTMTTTNTTPEVYAGTGHLNIMITDAPAEKEVSGIEITIASIAVHPADTDGDDTDDEDDWITSDMQFDDPIDLLELQGVVQELADDELPAGSYTQIRVEITAVNVYYADDEDTSYPAELPSGILKLVHPFTITNDENTTLVLDFSGKESLTFTGNGKVIFKPVVKVTAEYE